MRGFGHNQITCDYIMTYYHPLLHPMRLYSDVLASTIDACVSAAAAVAAAAAAAAAAAIATVQLRHYSSDFIPLLVFGRLRLNAI